MKAVVYEKFGLPEVLHLADIPKPIIADNEVLVRVKAVAVTAADSRIRRRQFPKGFGGIAPLIFGITRPRNPVLGGCYSGVVEAVGSKVSGFKVGDEVCGTTGIRLGCYAEYIKLSAAKNIIKKPQNVSHEDAAGVLFGGTTALYYLRDKLKVQPGEHVAVNGASGAVGTNAVQLAKYFGAHVTGVAGTQNVELVRSLGADVVIDYTQTSLSDSPDKFDVVLDTVGNISIESGKRLLTPTGRLGLLVASLGETIRARANVVAGPAPERHKDIELLLSLVAEGKLKVVVDEVYEMADVVAAHQLVDTHHKVGNVILTIPG